MTNSELQVGLAKLTDIQREAVIFSDGALLVLAGPGSGKTQVLTCRIARILEESADKNFRVLALTFTNKAADEMMSRVRAFVPGLEERANIGTFHSFCAQILRQHGVHTGIQPDFTIYSQEEDRRAVLSDGLKRSMENGNDLGTDDSKYLVMIDKLKSRLVGPDQTVITLSRFPDAEKIALVYRLYEEELRRVNALDFNSLIFEAHRLVVAFPAIAGRYRKSHPFWLLDEFQDTNHAQYQFLKALAGSEFKNIFAVADDDQIIYQWNGASFRHIQRFMADFSARQIQLPTNYRCPPAIVEAANHLVAYNADRTALKAPLIAGKKDLRLPSEEHIIIRVFSDEDNEANGVADEIYKRGSETWGQTAVLARTRALLERVRTALQQKNISSAIVQRRDDFLSPEFRWLAALLRQALRPQDKRNVTVLVEAFNRVTDAVVQCDQVIADAEVLGISYLASWFKLRGAATNSETTRRLLDLTEPLITNISSFKTVVDSLTGEFQKQISKSKIESDLAEDLVAWREISREVANNVGRNLPLDQFLQELQLRSKEPTPNPQAVRLMTIHGSKGREFDFVFVIGLAEEVMPSYQSLQKGDKSPEMEEERRNCFVAITRTKECLVLTRAEEYRGYTKKPSRFLREMGFVD